MCGFAGCLNDISKIDGQTENNTVHEMTNMLVHRGPDDSGYFEDDHITMGFRRLSIIDLDGGHQPLSYDNERYWLTFNGEIYNFVELRNDLIKEGYTFKTESDSEVILALYAKYHADVTKYLRGMFAFVIWDKKEQTFFAARDQFGIKPFYYAIQNDQLFYASESKAIYKILAHKTLDQDALQDYMTFQFVPEPETLTKEIKILSPGCTLTKQIGKTPLINRYYHREFHPTNESEAVYTKKIREVLQDSVKMHMRSDVPVGSFLSGGIDSSIIVAMAKNLNPHLETISVGFEREGYSELDVAQETADKLGVKNYSSLITPEAFMEAFPKFVWSMDDPLADPAAVPQYFLAKEAVKHVKVALTGEGADELFGGYTIYHEPESLKLFNYTRPINGALNYIAQLIPKGVKGRSFLLRGTVPMEKRYVGNAFIFNEKEKRAFFKNYNTNHPFQKITKPFYDESAQYDPITRMQFIDMHTWLNGDLLHNADRTTMAHSLELRIPFVDREVFKVAASIPADLRISHGTTKYILRKAVEGIVPDHVLHRKKLGFPVPIRFWLKNEMYDWARTIIQESQTEQYFDKNYFLKLLDDHRDGVADNSRKLWTILTFMMWHKIYVEEFEPKKQ
ncbi:asparagine synthase (glutamine-hydrolyzing) [Pediococcus ethanolidurans]|uniref:asparagine synthase (glutamine-hydrolyzing) n=1 Tax=Pediococcus ethanolidurans TaxID=319653 RepID=UPI001C1F130F|nr:asparagine synthase (glutamine-hydrolyzing) [Pediococcus ethanolidurans]MBU7562982.1 asparagine synthase (glutamine-hydrolyzing) [Pediococcus ethanolidurans]MCT4397343.1 asparagine synthase (glutamine-hydrolyzing) [Pediococcus ethanolidurans]MCV3315213.1 asparagine synthase (glutamine-hydrolyzing) [Pediococcus ethanolidurans]MCV3321281.1 asparagine synthase (glutamine-hydrolyzing) [Pediococcus ethanolidurans]MCV3554302.1 asparagine synthase (glutamine-hydrolyzing) [Pediococcus ethanoliduran